MAELPFLGVHVGHFPRLLASLHMQVVDLVGATLAGHSLPAARQFLTALAHGRRVRYKRKGGRKSRGQRVAGPVSDTAQMQQNRYHNYTPICVPIGLVHKMHYSEPRVTECKSSGTTANENKYMRHVGNAPGEKGKLQLFSPLVMSRWHSLRLKSLQRG